MSDNGEREAADRARIVALVGELERDGAALEHADFVVRAHAAHRECAALGEAARASILANLLPLVAVHAARRFERACGDPLYDAASDDAALRALVERWRAAHRLAPQRLVSYEALLWPACDDETRRVPADVVAWLQREARALLASVAHLGVEGAEVRDDYDAAAAPIVRDAEACATHMQRWLAICGGTLPCSLVSSTTPTERAGRGDNDGGDVI